MQCNDGKDHGYGHQVHLRAVRRHLACSGRRQATGHVPRTDVPVALLEPTDLPSQGKQDIKVRQGRNLRSQGVTDVSRRIPVDMDATPAATSAVGVSGRRAAAHHATFQGVDPVPVTVAPRLVDAPETRVRMGREQHPQRAYTLPVVVDGHAGSTRRVV